jgi:hypothetical protein
MGNLGKGIPIFGDLKKVMLVGTKESMDSNLMTQSEDLVIIIGKAVDSMSIMVMSEF